MASVTIVKFTIATKNKRAHSDLTFINNQDGLFLKPNSTDNVINNEFAEKVLLRP